MYSKVLYAIIICAIKSRNNSSNLLSVKVEDVYLDPARIAAMKVERLQREKADALVSTPEDDF